MKNSAASKPSAAIARVAGPPQGVIPLIMPSDNNEIVLKSVGSSQFLRKVAA